MPRDRSRSRSASPRRSSKRDLPRGVNPIAESDYFLKLNEFRVWLKDEKDRYFEDLSGEKARHYFRKFVKAWNSGRLSKTLYDGIDEWSSSRTKHKWGFASKSTRADREAIDKARHAVGAATKGALSDDEGDKAFRSASPPRHSRGSRTLGPTLPTSSDLTLARELEGSTAEAERSYKRRRERAEDKERIEDMVGPREQGREGQLEKKRARREEGRARADAKDDAGGEVDEKTLMGGGAGDSFQAAIARREASKKRFEEKKRVVNEESKQRVDAMKEKEKATMDMFKKIAKERFG